ncbi:MULTISPECIES: hypothetical protein [unclassified Sphingosinithalassobacter]|uniref:hypothetical protein n=1 Tax=unclassified Sphingosinithalassobacter TaxID=2676235 RepID=UPI00165DABB5|nr:hypothetical protein [Sphingosinithalassobacter sp. CS137]
MSNGDRRLHQGSSRHLDEQQRNPSEREDAYAPEADAIGRDAGPEPRGATEDIENEGSTRDRDQNSALGGDVATRSSTAPTPEDERAG